MDADLITYCILGIVASISTYLSNIPIYKHNAERKKQLQEENEKNLFKVVNNLQTLAKSLEKQQEETKNAPPHQV